MDANRNVLACRNSIRAATIAAAVNWQERARTAAQEAEYFSGLARGFYFSREYIALAAYHQNNARRAHEEVRVRLEALLG